MIALRPFRAWRPAPDKAHLVGSRSYVSYTPGQLAEKLAGNPYSFLHVLRPDDGGAAALPRAERFHCVRVAFRSFCDEGVLLRDERPCIYVYEQRGRGNTSIGIIAGVSVADLRNGRIRTHEQTLTARENLFAEYLGSTGINAEPVLLATPEGTAWERLLDPLLAVRPDFDFTTTDRVRHRLWAVDDTAFREALQRAFANIPALYVADGHHRLASSARLAEANDATDVSPESWCLACIVPWNGLFIHNYDRAVRDLGSHTEASLIGALKAVGALRRVDAPFAAPGTVGVRTASGWHVLELPPPPTSPAARLDAARLGELVLAPLLGVHDPRTDPRMTFVPGTEGIAALDQLVDSGRCQAAFHLHPVTFAQLRAVADADGTMPPKSTWIEPKLRSGLTVYSMEDV